MTSQVKILGNRKQLLWPGNCACCGCNASTTGTVSHTAYSGSSSVHIRETKKWEVPCCANCKHHTENKSLEQKGPSSGFFSVLRGILTGNFAPERKPVGSSLDSLAQESRNYVQNMRSDTCTFRVAIHDNLQSRMRRYVAEPPVEYKYTANTHVFMFSNDAYARAFADSNSANVDVIT
jgi:hypothetical protein